MRTKNGRKKKKKDWREPNTCHSYGKLFKFKQIANISYLSSNVSILTSFLSDEKSTLCWFIILK